MQKINVRRMLILGLTLFVLSSTLYGQGRGAATAPAEKYVISANAGGVGHVEGPVSVVRLNGTSGLLLKGDQIEVAEPVSTGSNARAEILLNPGSYMRLGPDSEAEFKTTDLDNLQISIRRGTAIFEVYAANDFRVTIILPKGRAELVETGVYRFSVSPEGSGTIAVVEGKAEVAGAKVKEGRMAGVGTEAVAVTKFDRGDRDEFAEWSRSRSKGLAKMTASLKNREVRDTLLTSFNRGVWGMHRSFGLWVYNPYLRGYCFLPFGYGWSSPYGYHFGDGIWWYGLPPWVYYSPPRITPRNNPPVTSSKSGDGIVRERPPHTRIEGGKHTPGNREIRDFDLGGGRQEKRSDPVFQPAPAPMPMPMPSVPVLKGGKDKPDNR